MTELCNNSSSNNDYCNDNNSSSSSNSSSVSGNNSINANDARANTAISNDTCALKMQQQQLTRGPLCIMTATLVALVVPVLVHLPMYLLVYLTLCCSLLAAMLYQTYRDYQRFARQLVQHLQHNYTDKLVLNDVCQYICETIVSAATTSAGMFALYSTKTSYNDILSLSNQERMQIIASVLQKPVPLVQHVFMQPGGWKDVFAILNNNNNNSSTNDDMNTQATALVDNDTDFYWNFAHSPASSPLFQELQHDRSVLVNTKVNEYDHVNNRSDSPLAIDPESNNSNAINMFSDKNNKRPYRHRRQLPSTTTLLIPPDLSTVLAQILRQHLRVYWQRNIRMYYRAKLNKVSSYLPNKSHTLKATSIALLMAIVGWKKKRHARGIYNSSSKSLIPHRNNNFLLDRKLTSVVTVLASLGVCFVLARRSSINKPVIPSLKNEECEYHTNIYSGDDDDDASCNSSSYGMNILKDKSVRTSTSSSNENNKKAKDVVVNDKDSTFKPPSLTTTLSTHYNRFGTTAIVIWRSIQDYTKRNWKSIGLSMLFLYLQFRQRKRQQTSGNNSRRNGPQMKQKYI